MTASGWTMLVTTAQCLLPIGAVTLVGHFEDNSQGRLIHSINLRANLNGGLSGSYHSQFASFEPPQTPKPFRQSPAFFSDPLPPLPVAIDGGIPSFVMGTEDSSSMKSDWPSLDDLTSTPFFSQVPSPLMRINAPNWTSSAKFSFASATAPQSLTPTPGNQLLDRNYGHHHNFNNNSTLTLSQAHSSSTIPSVQSSFQEQPQSSQASRPSSKPVREVF